MPAMGKVIFGMSVSLDGFVDTPSHSLDWVHVDEELHGWFNDQARKMRTSMYGRRMYELMTGYWATAEDDPNATPVEVEFARIWKNTPRVVFSRTLKEVGWNSRLVREGAAEEVARLKKEPGDMDVGGPTLAATLLEAGLIDEVHLYLEPVILGAGTRFFPPLEARIELKLLDTRRFASGVILLRYETIASE
jgi:dihydrofolate reductase